MSVIPFILHGAHRTITLTRKEYEAAGGLNGPTVLIHDFDASQFSKDDDKCNASYDLRVGDEYRDHRDPGKTELKGSDNIVLRPGAAVIIETAETVQFPKTRFGHIIPKVSLLQRGLSNTSSKIDPGYNGKLVVTVFNLGKKKVTLTRGQPFCTLYMLEIRNDATPYTGVSKRITGEQKKNKFREWLDAIVSNTTITALTTLIAFTGALIAAIYGVLQILEWFGIKYK